MDINWNKANYMDCMDEKEGLPSLKDNSIDLCFTNPPWGNSSFKNWKKGTVILDKKLKAQHHLHFYDDKWNPKFNLQWFTEIKRICNRIIIVTGQDHLKFWFNLDPTGMLIIRHINGYSRDNKIATWNNYTPYLYWGKFKHKLTKNIIDHVINWGFLAEKPKNKWIHPSPDGFKLPKKIFKKIKPDNIIDPFLGSGSYIQAATMLGIPWTGYEIDTIYKQDIEKRLNEINLKKSGLYHWFQ